MGGWGGADLGWRGCAGPSSGGRAAGGRDGRCGPPGGAWAPHPPAALPGAARPPPGTSPGVEGGARGRKRRGETEEEKEGVDLLIS